MKPLHYPDIEIRPHSDGLYSARIRVGTESAAIPETFTTESEALVAALEAVR